ncbi:MAG: CCA tRNA nucleotidyltransferase [Gammaproteobacteria bacterium]|nr:CCA tRNA nucleotidyltransferase [Gammaproteobacteria bacterium]
MKNMIIRQNLQIPERIFKLPENSYIVGGAVRDYFLGKEPKDIDITTEATPDELLELFPDAITLGIRFGTIIVDGIEITTMRKDISPGRHPNVEFTDNIFLDLSRRDFTINAMAINLHGLSKVYITDFYAGRYDIDCKILSCVGNPEERLREDPLRALRAIRFATQLDFRIAPSLKAAIRHTSIAEISAERIKSELLKSFVCGARKTIDLLIETELIGEIFPEVLKLSECSQNKEYHPEGDAFLHTMQSLEWADGHNFTPIQKMATLLHDIGKMSRSEYFDADKYPGHAKLGVPIAKEILQRLKFSNDEQSEILFAVENHMKMHTISEMKKSKRYTLYRSEYFETLLKVNEADCFGRRACDRDFVCEDIKNMPKEKEKPLVNGHDLMEMGYEPGIYLGNVLKILYDFQVDKLIISKEEGIDHAELFLETKDDNIIQKEKSYD